MAVNYSPDEIDGILTAMSDAPASDIKYKKFERLGVLMTEEDAPAGSNDEHIVHTCSKCRKTLPTAHLLDLHIAEHHDSYFQLKKEKQPMVSQTLPPKVYCFTKSIRFQYACFINGCVVMSSTVEERKDHCIRDHHFPPNFRFDSDFSTKPKPPLGVPKENGQENNRMDTSGPAPKPQPRVLKENGHGTNRMDTSGPQPSGSNENGQGNKINISGSIKYKTEMVNGRQIHHVEAPAINATMSLTFENGPPMFWPWRKNKSPERTANGRSAMDRMNEDLNGALPDSEDVELVPVKDKPKSNSRVDPSDEVD